MMWMTYAHTRNVEGHNNGTIQRRDATSPSPAQRQMEELGGARDGLNRVAEMYLQNGSTHGRIMGQKNNGRKKKWPIN